MKFKIVFLILAMLVIGVVPALAHGDGLAVICFVDGEQQEEKLLDIYTAKLILEQYPDSYWGHCEEPDEPREPRESSPDPVPWAPPAENITAWSVTGSRFFWQIADANGNWHDVRDSSGNLIITTVEYRDRFNTAIGAVEEDVAMTRLVRPAGSDTDPTHYRVFNADTGELTGVWVEFSDEWCQDFHVCGVSDFRG